MKLVKIWEKLGKQNLKHTKHQDAVVYILNHPYFIKSLRYNAGLIQGFEAVQITCENCKHNGCSVCNDCSNQQMWSYQKEE